MYRREDYLAPHLYRAETLADLFATAASLFENDYKERIGLCITIDDAAVELRVTPRQRARAHWLLYLFEPPWGASLSDFWWGDASGWGDEGELRAEQRAERKIALAFLYTLALEAEEE